MVSVDDMIEQLKAAQSKKPGLPVELAEEDISTLLKQVREVFLQDDMLLKVEAPVRICGDMHGQYFDLLRLFQQGGFPPDVSIPHTLYLLH
jgi:serine/threonine-protein phosphatase PP1 catalytic subunit